MNDDTILTEAEAADFLRIAPKTLSQWRWRGLGPSFLKLGGAVRYSMADLVQFTADCSSASTSTERRSSLV